MNWMDEMIRLTILYRMSECKEKIPVLTDGTPYEFIESALEDLAAKEMIAIDVDLAEYKILEKGREMCRRLLGIYDQVMKFEIFSSVNVSQILEEGCMDEEGNLHPELYDPRFQSPKSMIEQDELGTEDLRIAMMDFLATEMNTEHPLDPRRIVFMQMLSTGSFRKSEVWFDLASSHIFDKINEIVESAYQWQDAADDKEDARQAMIGIYTAGMLEQQKRDGQECSECSTPLAMFETWAKEDGKTLDDCPNPECDCTFKPPPPDYECPACKSGVTKNQRTCSCGAILDFSLPPGTIQTETTKEIEEDCEPIWTNTYGYVPYGYYNAYDPFLDAAAFGLMCAVLW